MRPPSPRLRWAGERVEQLGLEFFDVDLPWDVRAFTYIVRGCFFARNLPRGNPLRPTWPPPRN